MHAQLKLPTTTPGSCRGSPIVPARRSRNHDFSDGFVDLSFRFESESVMSGPTICQNISKFIGVRWVVGRAPRSPLSRVGFFVRLLCRRCTAFSVIFMHRFNFNVDATHDRTNSNLSNIVESISHDGSMTVRDVQLKISHWIRIFFVHSHST